MITIFKCIFLFLITIIIFLNDIYFYQFYYSKDIIYFSCIFIIVSLFFLKKSFFEKFFYFLIILSLIFSFIINVITPEIIIDKEITYTELFYLIFLIFSIIINIKYIDNTFNKNIIFYFIIILFLLYSTIKLDKNNENIDLNVNHYNTNNLVYAYFLNKGSDFNLLFNLENNKELNNKIKNSINEYIEDVKQNNVLKDKYLRYNEVDKKRNKIFFIEISCDLKNKNNYFLLKYEEDYLFDYELEFKKNISYIIHFVFLFFYFRFIFYKKYFKLLRNE